MLLCVYAGAIVFLHTLYQVKVSKCEKLCECNQTNSFSCDEDTGKCSCRPEYFGDFCNCITGVHICDPKISICHRNSSDNAICLCKPGFTDSKYQNEKCLKEYVRFINRTSSNEGVVEIYGSGSWGGVCKNGMTKKDAQVVCREFGLPWNYAQKIRKIITVPSSYFKWSDINCNGTEQSLLDCEREYDSSAYCYKGQPATIACPNEPWIRLTGKQTSSTQTRGTLQIYHNKEWGYVCESGFEEDDAKVACLELGLPTKYVKKTSWFSRATIGKPHLMNVDCRGDEERLSDCSADIGSKCPSFGNRVEISCDSVCAHMTYGDNCKVDCPCDRINTESCDMESGECVCKPGYTGFSCNCQTGSHTCNTTVSDCYEESSEVFCICKNGFTNSKNNCTDNVRINSDGIVQVFEGDRWDVICNTNLKENARVICRHLNKSTEAIYSTSKHHNYRYTKKSVNCTGTEDILSECPSRMDSFCPYSPVIHCGDCPDWRYSEDCSKSCDCNRETSTVCDFRDGTCSCRDGFTGDDCSCHVSTTPCSGSYSKCKYDRCICKEGSFCNRKQNSLMNNLTKLIANLA